MAGQGLTQAQRLLGTLALVTAPPEQSKVDKDRTSLNEGLGLGCSTCLGIRRIVSLSRFARWIFPLNAPKYLEDFMVLQARIEIFTSA